jgi:glycosyltransferase involved in cell wall biosynthesis
MRIALIGPVYPYRGGIAHYTSMLYSELSKMHQVKMISFKRLFPKWLYPGKSDKDPSNQPLNIPAEYLIDSMNPVSWWKTSHYIKQLNPDLVIIQWWVTFLTPTYTLIAYLIKKFRIPVLFLIHNVFPHEGGWIHKPLSRLTLRQGDYFIVHTPIEEKRLLSLVPDARIVLCSIPPYSGLVGNQRISKKEARRYLGFPQDADLVLFFGIVRPYKGLNYLLEALGQLRKEDTIIHLIIAGEFWQDKSIFLQAIKRLQIEEQIRIEDRYIPNEEIQTYFSAADALIAPYIEGTQSAVASLALVHGIPMIGTEIGLAGNRTQNNRMVIIVPPKDSNALAKAIKDFFRDPLPHRTTRIHKNGWQEIVKGIESLLRGF